MARKELVVCDNCEATKVEEDWWQLHVEKLSPAEKNLNDKPAMLLSPYGDERMPPWTRGERYDLCGEACVVEVTKRVRAGEPALRNQI